MERADQNGIREHVGPPEGIRPAESTDTVHHEPGPDRRPDIRRPGLLTPGRLAFTGIGAIAVWALTWIVAWLGTFAGGIVLAVLAGLCILTLIDHYRRRVREDVVDERRREKLLRMVDAVDQPDAADPQSRRSTDCNGETP